MQYGKQWFNLSNGTTHNQNKNMNRETVEQETGFKWATPVDGKIHVPDELDKLVNKMMFQYGFHKYSGLFGPEEMVCRMAEIAQDYFKWQSTQQPQESAGENKYNLDHIKRMCCWLFDGDYIHTLTNSHDLHNEIVRLVDIYSTYPQFYADVDLFETPPTPQAEAIDNNQTKK